MKVRKLGVGWSHKVCFAGLVGILSSLLVCSSAFAANGKDFFSLAHSVEGQAIALVAIVIVIMIAFFTVKAFKSQSASGFATLAVMSILAFFILGGGWIYFKGTAEKIQGGSGGGGAGSGAVKVRR